LTQLVRSNRFFEGLPTIFAFHSVKRVQKYLRLPEAAGAK